MGQAQASSTWDTYEPHCDIAPGMYRIIHDGTNKVLQIHEENHKTLIIRDRQGQGSDNSRAQNDHWFILRSGDAFIFKHYQSESYISGLLGLPVGAQPLCATRYPTTWAVRRKKDSLKCAITIPVDWDEFRPKDSYIGIGVNSTSVRLCIIPFAKKEELDQLWRLERIGDTTYEEDCANNARELERQLQAANSRCTSDELELLAMKQKLVAKEVELANMQSELGKQGEVLKAVQNASRKQAAELKEQHKVLDAIKKLLNAKEPTISEDDEKSEDSGVLREKVQEVFSGEKEPPNLEVGTDEAVKDDTVGDRGLEGADVENYAVENSLNKQVPSSTTQEQQRKGVESHSLSNATTEQSLPEPAAIPRIGIQTVQPLPASVEQKLAEIGFFHFG
ncbi:hypothetical protein RSOL_226090 [Rhizoctonia solani AG-3 Rhs1AP]|uniref:Ricin B lectin domain-containing protein n=1 Tax=Rhizoctonia solani AG-3 Rhs1AP TaxID=1086054 RepID=X8J5Q1_9AGAM|nr:hypothetical protein RSOL_226090 [Rhizoctonia solani AG-3 Rhs1AP]